MTQLPDNVRAAMERVNDCVMEGHCLDIDETDWQTVRDYLVRQEANAARYVWFRDSLLSPWAEVRTKGRKTAADIDATLDSAIEVDAMLAAAAREG